MFQRRERGSGCVIAISVLPVVGEVYTLAFEAEMSPEKKGDLNVIKSTGYRIKQNEKQEH